MSLHKISTLISFLFSLTVILFITTRVVYYTKPSFSSPTVLVPVRFDSFFKTFSSSDQSSSLFTGFVLRTAKDDTILESVKNCFILKDKENVTSLNKLLVSINYFSQNTLSLFIFGLLLVYNVSLLVNLLIESLSRNYEEATETLETFTNKYKVLVYLLTNFTANIAIFFLFLYEEYLDYTFDSCFGFDDNSLYTFFYDRIITKSFQSNNFFLENNDGRYNIFLGKTVEFQPVVGRYIYDAAIIFFGFAVYSTVIWDLYNNKQQTEKSRNSKVAGVLSSLGFLVAWSVIILICSPVLIDRMHYFFLLTFHRIVGEVTVVLVIMVVNFLFTCFSLLLVYLEGRRAKLLRLKHFCELIFS